MRLMSTDPLLIHYSTRSQLCVCVVQGCSISDCEAVTVQYQASCLKLLHFQAYLAAQCCTFSNCCMGSFPGNNLICLKLIVLVVAGSLFGLCRLELLFLGLDVLGCII